MSVKELALETSTFNRIFTKLYTFDLFSIKEIAIQNKNGYEVYLVDHSRIQSLYGELHEDVDATETSELSLKRKCKLAFSFSVFYDQRRISIN